MVIQMSCYLWPNSMSKKYLGMDPDTWRTIQKNVGFFTAKGVPRKRKTKKLIPLRQENGNFKAACDQ